MDLYIFSSATEKNIRIGYESGLWAVSDLDQSSMRRRFTKSQKMLPGSCGLIYCTEQGNKHFGLPFVTISQPSSVDETIVGVWDRPWFLPFKIRPLGPYGLQNSRRVSLDAAKDWEIYRDVSNITLITPMGGRYAFNACPISESGWNEIVRMLGYKEGEIP